MTGQSTIEVPGGDYNVVPYVSKPFPQTQPARLAALATMFALSPPDVSTARVLELGSASGGNLIPLALRFPGARFRGIDLAERHVEDGRARIAALGLANVVVEQGDIATIDLGDERFDYIICHGVYSWVPLHVRDAVLALTARHLSPAGVAYISYNVLPGWHMRRVIRDMMLFHAGSSGDPAARVAKARFALDAIAGASRETTSFGAMLRHEAQTLSELEDSYILGEFLAEENAPCYFTEFAARAEAHGLTYLCESELDQALPENLGADAAGLIRTMSGDKLIPLEQYMDWVKGRTFRQSLLVSSAQAARIDRRLVPARLGGLHVAGRGTFGDQGAGQGADKASEHVFTTPAGGTLTTRHPGVRHAFERLAQAYPATRSLAQLADDARAAAGRDWPDLAAAILDAVFKAAITALVDLSSVPRVAAPAGSGRPTATPLARLDGAENASWTTGLDHSVVALDVVAAALLPHLDGSNGLPQLQRLLIDAVDDGRLRLLDDATGEPLVGARLGVAAELRVREALGRLAEAGLIR